MEAEEIIAIAIREAFKCGKESEEVTFQVQSVPGNRIGSEPNEHIAALEKEVNELARICEEKDATISDLRQMRDSDRWFQLLKATHRKLKRAQRTIKYHHRTSKLQYGIFVSQKSDYDSMRIRMEKAEKKVSDITDNIDKFIEDRRRLAEDKDVLLTLSQQTQINEKNKLIEQLKKENEELKAKLYEKQQTEETE